MDTATADIYTLSLHDALPICLTDVRAREGHGVGARDDGAGRNVRVDLHGDHRSEEHTSELQSHSELVCRLLREKKKELFNPSCIGSSLELLQIEDRRKRLDGL